MSTDTASISWELSESQRATWIMDGNITAPTPARMPTLGFDQLDAELEKQLLDAQRRSVRNSTAQETASFSLLNNLVLFAGQNSISSESAGWFLACFLRF